jgi:hypothetical protein
VEKITARPGATTVCGLAPRGFDLLYFPLDSLDVAFVHSRHARKEVVQWTVAINPARWLTLRS